MHEFKVSSKSSPNSVAGAIASRLKEHDEAALITIGAGAANQAVKAIAIARRYVASSGIDLVCIPAFGELVKDGHNITTLKFIIRKAA